MIKPLRFFCGTFALSLIVSLPLWAGPQLSAKKLVQKSAAVAKVKIHWNKKEAATIEVVSWLKAPKDNIVQQLQSDAKSMSGWTGICLPDQNLLKHWIKTYPHFEKDNIQLWKDALSQKGYETLLFLKPNPQNGLIRPTCETEALLAKGWTTHSQYAAYANTVQKLLTPDPKPKPPAPKPEPEPQKVKEPQIEPQPPENKSCSCQSTH